MAPGELALAGGSKDGPKGPSRCLSAQRKCARSPSLLANPYQGAPTVAATAGAFDQGGAGRPWPRAGGAGHPRRRGRLRYLVRLHRPRGRDRGRRATRHGEALRHRDGRDAREGRLDIRALEGRSRIEKQHDEVIEAIATAQLNSHLLRPVASKANRSVHRDPCGNIVKPTDPDYADCAEVK